MKLTWPERTILTMLCELHHQLDVQSSVDTKFIKDALDHNQDWALSFELEDTNLDETYDERKDAAREVVDFLDMWRFLKSSLDALEPDQREEVQAQPGYREFYGFDGNNEIEHLSAARFLVEHMGRFEEFSPINNSHSEFVPRYRAMLDKFSPIRANLSKDRQAPFNLTKDELMIVFSE